MLLGINYHMTPRMAIVSNCCGKLMFVGSVLFIEGEVTPNFLLILTRAMVVDNYPDLLGKCMV